MSGAPKARDGISGSHGIPGRIKPALAQMLRGGWVQPVSTGKWREPGEPTASKAGHKTRGLEAQRRGSGLARLQVQNFTPAATRDLTLVPWDPIRVQLQAATPLALKEELPRASCSARLSPRPRTLKTVGPKKPCFSPILQHQRQDSQMGLGREDRNRATDRHKQDAGILAQHEDSALPVGTQAPVGTLAPVGALAEHVRLPGVPSTQPR